jgi:hypothetical protein
MADMQFTPPPLAHIFTELRLEICAGNAQRLCHHWNGVAIRKVPGRRLRQRLENRAHNTILEL